MYSISSKTVWLLLILCVIRMWQFVDVLIKKTLLLNMWVWYEVMHDAYGVRDDNMWTKYIAFTFIRPSETLKQHCKEDYKEAWDSKNKQTNKPKLINWRISTVPVTKYLFIRCFEMYDLFHLNLWWHTCLECD